MASLQYRSGSYRVLFNYHGKQHAFTIGAVEEAEAHTKAAQVDYLLMRLRQGLIHLPPGLDVVEFLRFDGNPPETLAAIPEQYTLANLRDRYLATHESSLEASTVYGIRLHFKHIAGFFGEKFPIADLSLADLQRYVDKRAKAKGLNGRKLSAATIKKELISLRTAWNWGARMKIVAGRFPYDGLRYPRSAEKPPFQTRQEIERKIKAGGLTEAEIAELWDALYLTVPEINDLLTYVKEHAVHPFIYPMFCVAAHTGARRSEIIRLKTTDVDLGDNTITIRERKRVHGKATTRRVPMSAFLASVMKDWLAVHPGGPWLFCHGATVQRSKKRSAVTGHQSEKNRSKTVQGRLATLKPRAARQVEALTKDEATDHFNRTLKDSKWGVLKGWHVLRHCFVSACASKGTDQRLVQAWAGHMSAEMSRRYAHLWPSVQRDAMERVFG